MNFSLRGTLAQQLSELLREGDFERATGFLESLLVSEDPDLVREQSGVTLIIGRDSERGTFAPDW